MPANPTAADVATEANGLLTGLGILTFQIFPFALPLLVLCIGPLVVLAVAGALLVAPLIVPIWLARVVRRAAVARRSRKRGHVVTRSAQPQPSP
jgi:hypothetical protein